MATPTLNKAPDVINVKYKVRAKKSSTSGIFTDTSDDVPATPGNCICIICKKKGMASANMLCRDCSRIVGQDSAEMDKYRLLLKKSKHHSRVVKAAAESIEPSSQRKARKTLLKICKWFGINMLHEHSLSPYVVDLYIKQLKIAIEIDGASHDHRVSYDAKRDTLLMKKYGVKVFRFYAHQVGTIYFRKAIYEIIVNAFHEKLASAKIIAAESGLFSNEHMEAM